MEFKLINTETLVMECTEVLRSAFATVACDFNLTEEKAPTHPAFMTPERLREYLQKDVALFGLFKMDAMIGCIAMEKSRNNPGEYYIERLAVLPEERHQGYGSRLLNFIENLIIEKGGNRSSVGIINENAVLKGWYIKSGYQEISTKIFPRLPFTVCFLEKILEGHQ
ncbi:MAG: GNAT family N-acetyltransferase [Spirochaetales bacterium]|nr:GNAT family N-acetyltransferase [Spirochaetales bacterium]